MKKPLWLLLAFLVALAFARSQAAVLTLATRRLTDRAQSTQAAYDLTVAAASTSVHVAWTEYAVYDVPGGNFDSDVFYAQLPGGAATRLSDPAATGPNASAGAIAIAIDSAGRATVAWLEETESWGYDLFLWQTGLSAPLNLSDHAATSSGPAGVPLLLVDGSDVAHVLWAEQEHIGIGPTAIYYWTEGSPTTRLSIGDYQYAGLLGVYPVALLEQAGVVHALWLDQAPAAPQPFYWNSADQVAVGLRDPADPTTTAGVMDYFLDDSGVMHVLWQLALKAPSFTNDYRYWNSADESSVTLLNAPNTIPVWFALAQDGSGTAHVFYDFDYDVFHWDSDAQTTLYLGPSDGRFPVAADGLGSGTVHIAWRAQDSDWPGHFEDIFYWRPELSAALNVTNHTFPGDAPDDYLKLIVDENDVAHIAWDEEPGFYYNSASSVTQAITGPAVPIPPDSQSCGVLGLCSAGGPGVVVEPGHDFLVLDGVAYWLLRQDGATAAPLYLWQADTGAATPIPAVYGTGAASDALLWADEGGDLHVAWTDAVAGEESNRHTWNAADGSSDLTDNGDTTGIVRPDYLYAAADGAGRATVLWTEDAGGEESYDVYAAEEEIIFSDFVYLPLARAGQRPS